MVDLRESGLVSDQSTNPEDHVDYVRAISYKICGSHPDIEDYISCGMIGLMRACETYDPTEGAQIRSWIYVNVQREIRDAMRAASRAGADPRADAAYHGTAKVLSAGVGSDPDMTPARAADELTDLIGGLGRMFVLSRMGEGELAQVEGVELRTPLLEMTRSDLWQELTARLASLPDRLRIVVRLFYWCFKNNVEIAGIFGRHKANVGRSLKRAIEMLAADMTGAEEPSESEESL